MQPSAVAPTSAPSGSTGSSRQPRTSRPSSAAMASICSRAAGRSAGPVAGSRCRPRMRCSRPRSAGQFEVDDVAQELDGQLDQDARAVTAVGLGARCAAVLEVFEGSQAIGDDGVRTPALDVGDHGDTAGVGLVLRVVQTLGIGQCRKQHWRVLRSLEILSVRDCTGPTRKLYQRSSAATRREVWGPAGTRAGSGPPSRRWRGRRSTAIAGMRHDRPPGAPPHHDPRQQRGQADEQEDVVDDGSGKVAVQQVVGHPQAAARRAVPPR